MREVNMRSYLLVICLGTIFVLSCVKTAKREEELRTYIRDAMTAYTREEYDKSIDLYKKALEIKPDHPTVTYNVACCYALMEKEDEAIQWLEKTVELGNYKFDDDPDFENIKETEGFKKLLEKADKLLEELKDKEWKPIVSLPKRFKKDREYPLVIALHGFGSNPVDFSETMIKPVTEKGYILVCPYAPDIRGTTSFSWGPYELAEERVIKTLTEMQKEYRIDALNVILFGYSQGGSRAYYIGLRNSNLFKGVVVAAGSYKEEWNEYLPDAKKNKLKVYSMIGEEDFGLESNQKAKEVMGKEGIDVNLIVYPEVGHAFPPNPNEEIQKALDWIE